MKLLLKNGTLLDQEGNLTRDTDLLVADGVIKEMGQGLDPAGAQVVDCAGQVISPGLAVLHAHSPMHILRGLAEDVHIDDWFNSEIWPYESRITKEDIYWGARLCSAEMANHGVTVFADHYFGGQEIGRAVKETGLRVDIAHTIFGSGGLVEDEVAEALRLMELFAGDTHVKIRFGPHSPYLCSPTALERLVAEAKKAGVGIHLHVSETWRQEKESRDSFGQSHCKLISYAGGFDIPCIVAHGLWIPEEDVKLLGADTFVAVSPKTYMKLGMGRGTLWDHWQQMNLCIGTDGAASSNSVSPLEQVRLFALVGKFEDKATQFTLEEMWRLLMNGHRALGFGSGRLAVGAPADLVVWELETPATAPLYNPLAAIIYSAGPENVRHTIVGGEFVKKDGKLRVDQKELMENASRCAREITVRGKGESRLFF